MAHDVERKTAAMQGGGFYNRNSGLQAANITSALPLFEAAAEAAPIEGEAPLLVADYGASQGRNSMAPMRAAIAALRTRAGKDRAIEVVHTDLPSNDFAALFGLLDEDPSSYLAGQENLFAAAIGRSYFQPIFAPGRVTLGWSSNALHWLSRNPIDVADHIWAVFSGSEAARAAVDEVLADDWRRFLLARGSELAPGARLVCQFMGRGPERHGFEWMANALWQALSSMVDDGMLTSDEVLRMTCPSAGRSAAQIEAPFASGVFAGLALEEIHHVQAPDPFWDAYRVSGDAEALGRGWANVMRGANGPNIVSGLAAERDAAPVLDELFARHAAIVAAAPQRSESYNVMLVLRKLGAE